jgi:M61 glycyl aminopeptidase
MTIRTMIALLLGCLSSAVGAQAPVHYAIELDPAQRTLSAEVCVPSAATARRFRAAQWGADEYLRDPKRSSGRAIERRDGALVARDWQAGECLRYRVDPAALSESRRRGWSPAANGELLTSSHAWLWRPSDLAQTPDAEIEFSLPAGWNLSVPWRPLDRTPPRRRFALGATDPEWPVLFAAGRFDETDIASPAGRLRLAITGDTDSAQRSVLQRYAQITADDVAKTFPQVFRRMPQLVFIPIGARSKPVPYGQSNRGGGSGVMLFIDPAHPLADYLDSWTLTHELSHLTHPYLQSEGAWISEGIATYFQNVIRARAGHMSAQQAWDELDDGFERGRADVSKDDLNDTAASMDRGHHFMRVYWSGTALMLMADVELRTRRSNPGSVELALTRFADCCIDRQREWNAPDFLAELDRQVGGDTFSRLYRAQAHATTFPKLDQVYAQLGLHHGGDNVKRDNDDARVRTLRAAIMGNDEPH